MITTFIIFILLLAGILAVFKCKKSAVVLFVLALACLLGVGYGLVPALLLKNLESYPTLVKPEWGKNNAIVLLSAGTIRSPVNKASIPSSMAFARIHQAARLYFSCKKSGNRCLLITSGDDILKRNMAGNNVYLNELKELGVDKNDMLAESRSVNTYQNAKFTSDILKSKKFDKVFLVTSNIHMRRALFSFSRFGINPTPAPADYLKPQFTFMPRGYNFAVADAAAHEYGGMLKFYIYDHFGWKLN